LQPTEDEIHEKAQELVQSYPEKERSKALAELKKPARKEGLRRAILMDKALRFLTEQAVAVVE